MNLIFRLQPVLLILACILLAAFPVAALGAKFEWWGFLTGLALMAGAALTAAIILALSGIALLGAIRQHQPRYKQLSAAVIILLLPPVGVLFSFGLKASQVPMIHDVSTDRINPPAFNVLISQRPEGSNALVYSEENAALQAEFYRDIQPLLLSGNVGSVMHQIISVAEKQGWQVVSSAPDKGMIEATDTTFWFGFVDDIVIRVSALESGVKVDVRSVSRVGKSDLGKNAERIHGFLNQLKKDTL